MVMMYAAYLVLISVLFAACASTGDVTGDVTDATKSEGAVKERVERSLEPYGGTTSALRRYRYPIYNKRPSAPVAGALEQVDADLDVQKRFMRGINWMPMRQTERRLKRPFGITPRFDISMTPFDLQAINDLHRSGKREAGVTELSDLYRLYEAGRKRSPSASPDEQALWKMLELESVGKRSPSASPDEKALWKMLELESVGKRSPSASADEQALWKMLELESVGKRSPSASPDEKALWKMLELESVGKRSPSVSPDEQALWKMLELESIGKRSSYDDVDLLQLSALQQAGKRGAGNADSNTSKVHKEMKKRPWDDYFGWDSKSKRMSEPDLLAERDLLVDRYFELLAQKIHNDQLSDQ